MNSISISPNFVSITAVSAIAKPSSRDSTLIPRLRHRLQQAVDRVLEAAVARAQQDPARRVFLPRARETEGAIEPRLRRQQPAVAARLERVEELLGLRGTPGTEGRDRGAELGRRRLVLAGSETFREQRQRLRRGG